MNLHERLDRAKIQAASNKSKYGSAKMREDVYHRLTVAAKEDGFKIIDLLSIIAEDYLETRSAR